MEDLVEDLARGNVAETKVLLASVGLALAGYQVFLAAVFYRRLRLGFLAPRPASRTHRAVGDTIVVVLATVGVMCAAVYGFDDEGIAHALPGLALFAVLGVKIAVVRRGLGMARLLPVFGIAVFGLLAATWALSAGDFLG